jgi:two-component system KDP operon response regulator KdpE
MTLGPVAKNRLRGRNEIRRLDGSPAASRCLPGSRSAAGRIVVASSSARQREELRVALEFEGHWVVETETADRTLEELCSGLYQAVIVYAEFEGITAHELCRGIRLQSDLGIIVLGGHSDTKQGRIDAFNAGADDYLASPFVLRELSARVRAVLRRVTRSDEEGRQILLQDRAIDLKSYKVRGPGSRVSHLTPKEFLVLQCLVAHANKAQTHRSLAQTVWQRDGGGEVEYLRIVIRQLRQKLEPDPNHPRYILTERSVGYLFRNPAGPSAGAELSARLPLAG